MNKENNTNDHYINERDRVSIVNNYNNISLWRLLISFPLVFIPAIITLPFVFLGSFLIKVHLVLLGAKNIKPFKDFLPSRNSFRYTFKKQITVDKSIFFFIRWRIFWFYNCGIYCPYSVALFEYTAYLIKVVENWWCPFYHNKKINYSNAPIDKSYWHSRSDLIKNLHKDDADCPIWNDYNDENLNKK
jgi:hypothetical protein